MKSSVNFVFAVIYFRAIWGSENVFDNNMKDIGFANHYATDPGSMLVGDILLDKRFDYVTNGGQGIFGGSNNTFNFDQGNPDIHGIIERPCQVYDTFCIRKFLAEHSHCKISGRRLPDPFRRAQTNLNYPSANMSVTAIETLYGGLNNARVAEFYINKATDNLVIAFSFDAISFKSNNVNIKFYLNGREPEVHNDFGALDFNPQVVAMFLYFSTVGVPVEHLEELSTEGVFYGTNYLQYNICDFGLKVL